MPEAAFKEIKLVDLQEQLTRIGFTEYESKVYLALLSQHPATGYQISKESSVPRSMVYETLSRLHSRGAVLETVEDRVTLYRPLPPATLLERLEVERRQLVADLSIGLQALYTETRDDRVWSIHGRSAALTYATQMIRAAETDIFLVLTDEDVDALHDTIADVASRDVAISTLLTGEEELGVGRVAHHPPLESELQELTDTLVVVVDNDEALIASPSRNQETRATITSNPHLVLITRQFIWMELFTQRIYASLGTDLLSQLDPEDRRIFES
jgi:sugar-specific transcriptional regulator TrmB